jgi:hypothetical protein
MRRRGGDFSMRRDIVITALLTFCLTATLFMIATSRSQEYDPWADLNEDGIIDIFDVVGVTGIYETTGDTTKNVTIAGHANRLAYSVRNVVIPATSWFTSDPILVDGYSKMTVSLVFACDGPEFDYWLWSGHDSSSFAFLADTFDETALGVINCKTYDVMNMYIKIRVRNPQAFEGYLSLDVYLIP